MTVPLILEYYDELPQRESDDHPLEWKIRRQAANAAFKKKVGKVYTPGTLLRLLESDDERVRRASVLALGMIGKFDVNEPLAECLHDEDDEVWQLAAEALWALWMRADSKTNNLELQRILRMKNIDRAIPALDALITQAPIFAEAYNQRAILAYRQKRFQHVIEDCEKVLELNPFHFGAFAGMGKAYVGLRRHRSALKALRAALLIHPHLDDVADTIRKLEKKLGGEEQHDDRV